MSTFTTKFVAVMTVILGLLNAVMGVTGVSDALGPKWMGILNFIVALLTFGIGYFGHKSVNAKIKTALLADPPGAKYGNKV